MAPGSIFHFRQSGPIGLDVRPVLERLDGFRDSRSRIRPRRPHINPLADQLDLGVGEWRTAVGHLRTFKPRQPTNDAAVATAARNNNLAVLASLQNRGE